MRLHRQAVHADDAARRLLQHHAGNVILALVIGGNGGADDPVRDVAEVCHQLPRVLRQAVAAVAERRIVVVCADARVEAHAVDDLARIESLELAVGIELVEIAHAHGEIRVGKELDGLGLRRVRVQRRDISLRCALLQQRRKQMRVRLRRRTAARAADHNTARMQVIIQCPALAQKFRREQQPRAAKPAHNALRVADRHRGLDDHKRAGIDPAHEREHRLHGRGVEDLLLGGVVRRRGDDDHVCRAVGPLGGRERERLRAQKVRDLGVDDRRDAAVDVFGFGGGRGHGGDGVVLREQHRLRQTDIAHAGYGDVHIGPPVSQMISG